MPRRPIDPTIGLRIRTFREAAGMSQRLLADHAGLGSGHLSRIETGKVGADNRFTLAAIAKGLKRPVSDLTGQTEPAADDQTRAIDAAAFDSVRMIVEADLDFPPTVSPRPLPALAAQVQELREARKACDFLRLNLRAPATIRALHAVAVTADSPDREAALSLYVQAAENAAVGLRFTPQVLGTHDVAERAHQAAQLLGDPIMLGLAGWSRAQAALACGLYGRGVMIADRAYTALVGVQTYGATEVRGMLLLTAAFSQFADGNRDEARARVDEAADLAAQVGDTDTYGLMFGPTNVKFWSVAMEADGDDPARVLDIARGVNPAVVQSALRRASFHLDLARALTRLSKHEPATRQLLAFEREAPQRVTGDPLVAETVRTLLHSVQRRAGSKGLRGLAERVGVGSLV